MAWLLHDPTAGELIGAATVVFLAGEVGATIAGRAGTADACSGAWPSHCS